MNHIQAQLGRRPAFAAGNTNGDREMLSWAQTTEGPSLGVLIDHDDDREFSYPSTGEGAPASEPIVEVGRRRGWTLVSMSRDCSRSSHDDSATHWRTHPYGTGRPPTTSALAAVGT